MASTFIVKRENSTAHIAYEVVDTDVDEVSNNDLTGTVGGLGLVMYEIDNTGNTSTAVHLKVYDGADPADDGSDAVPTCLRVQGGVKRQFIGLNASAAAASATHGNLSLRCVTEAGSAGTTAPTAAVTVRILIKDMS